MLSDISADMTKSSFKIEHDFEKRRAEASRIRGKYPDRIPNNYDCSTTCLLFVHSVASSFFSRYDQGAYLFLPSYVIRTHGIKQQRETVKRTPRKQLELVFEALDTLGNTKWRINRRILGVVDRLWVNGGRLADLVDREDVGTCQIFEFVRCYKI
ncbi:hypothetical protein V6Z12_A03G104300 [Gossypium hirsutum]